MTIKYSRIPSLMFIVVSLAVGTPLALALAEDAILPKYNWIAWSFIAIALLTLLRGLKLFIAPPTVLEIGSDGIQIHYKFGRSFTRDADLLPWGLVDKMQLIRISSKDNTFNWAIELTLNASTPFDSNKRNAMRSSAFSGENTKQFYLDTFVLDQPREKVLEALQTSWRRWREKVERVK